jgi:hypothetical protein
MEEGRVVGRVPVSVAMGQGFWIAVPSGGIACGKVRLALRVDEGLAKMSEYALRTAGCELPTIASRARTGGCEWQTIGAAPRLPAVDVGRFGKFLPSVGRTLPRVAALSPPVVP